VNASPPSQQSVKCKSTAPRLLDPQLTLHRYKPDVKIRFITEELGFESDEESARFILEYASEDLLEERSDGVRLLTGKAGQIFENAKTKAFQRVDPPKGQFS
jgi:hypothetical protein